jgi:hypothetical protein
MLSRGTGINAYDTGKTVYVAYEIARRDKVENKSNHSTDQFHEPTQHKPNSPQTQGYCDS